MNDSDQRRIVDQTLARMTRRFSTSPPSRRTVATSLARLAARLGLPGRVTANNTSHADLAPSPRHAIANVLTSRS